MSRDPACSEEPTIRRFRRKAIPAGRRRANSAKLTGLLAASLGLAVALPLYGRPRDSASDDVVRRTLGCHPFTGGDRERQALAEAIEAVVQEFNIFLRPIVRRRLEASNPIAERLCFDKHGGDLSIALDDRKYTAPLDGRKVTVTGITGDDLQLYHQVLGDELRQIFVNDEAARINAYRPTESKGLTMRVRVHADRLPKDLVYRLTYGPKK